MKIWQTFRLDLRTKKLLQKIYENTSFKTYTEIVEKAIEEFAKQNNIKPVNYCKYMSKFEKDQIFCSKKGNWVHFSVCLKCREWSD